MSESTRVEFIWRKGISLAHLTKFMFDYFSSANMRFKELSDYRQQGRGFFSLLIYGSHFPFDFPHGPWEPFAPQYRNVIRRSEYLNEPWKHDLWNRPDFGDISWVVIEDAQKDLWWGAFHVRIEDSLPYSGGQKPMLVHNLSLGIEGDVCCCRPQDFDIVCRKYHRIKELYQLLDCDEVLSQNPDAPCYPFYRGACFRFAKEGTQVLPKSMEERRQIPGLDWRHSRIFIDPPGIQPLTPEEYERLAN